MQSPIFQLFFGLIVVAFIGLVTLNYSKTAVDHSIVEGTDLSKVELISIVEHIEQTAILQRDFDNVEMLKRGISPTEKNGYSRYYAVSESDNGTFVHGVYLRGSLNSNLAIADKYRLAGANDVYIVPGNLLPIVLDGGCSVLTVKYSVEESELMDFDYGQILEARSGEKPDVDEGPLVYHAFCNGIG